MDVAAIPWDRPLGVVFAIALLVIFIDLTYRKIPRGFTRIRAELRQQTQSLMNDKKADHENLQAVLTAIERLDTAIAALLEMQQERAENRGRRRPRSSKKSTGPAGRAE
jgi:hypothetical protein